MSRLSEITESVVTFESAAGDISLAGTLTAPSAGRDCPAAVLVTGTGALDRDAAFLGHKLFQVLAHQLARAGVASLRYDKRGVGESGGDFDRATPDDLVSDALSAQSHLVEGEGFDSDQTGMIGHSEGGMIALTAASTTTAIPYCVLMGSPLLSGGENLVESFSIFATGRIEPDDRTAPYAAELATLFKIALSGGASASDPQALDIANRFAPLIFNDSTAVVLGTSDMPGEGFIGLLTSPCLQTCIGWRPEAILPGVNCPVLLLHGSHDTQAPARANLAAAREQIDRLDKRSWEILEKPGLNHIFQKCLTGMPDEYAGGGPVMDDHVPRDVASWIVRTVGECRQ